MKKKYKSWGRYPESKSSESIKLFWYNEILPLQNLNFPLLAYGLGKSYGDSCLNSNGTVLETPGMNHILSFDNNDGILECEAGTSLEQIIDFSIPRGYFPASTPGTKLITVGGAIANDVHGKNHHAGGTFGCHVREFDLLRSNGELINCSLETNSELFKASIGGLGLTGLITKARLALKECPGPFIDIESIKFNSLEEFFEINEDSDKGFEYTVAWVDCTSTERGRGIFTRGNHSNLLESARTGIKLPFPFEFNAINPLTVNIFNMLYFTKQMNKIEKNTIHYNPFFYPLDAVEGWNKAYGKNGFIQYQFLIPLENALKNLKKILELISKSGKSSFLTVLKTFGDIKSPGLLSFPRPGVTLAIDFKMEGKTTLDLCNELDRMVFDACGTLYPAKDARMSKQSFLKSYPQWDEFKKFIDPGFSSDFIKRLGLINE